MFKLVDGKCPSCQRSISYTEREEGAVAWLPCCSETVVFKNGKWEKTGVKAYDWRKKELHQVVR